LWALIIVSAISEIMHDPLVFKLQIESQRHVANLVETMINAHFRDSGKGAEILTVEK
jgi:hypothetical protein